MSVKRPASGLDHFKEALQEESAGVYAEDNKRLQAAQQLMHELEIGRRSGEAEGWLTLEEVEESLGIAEE